MSWQKTIVLKGACTIVACPDGTASSQSNGQPGAGIRRNR